MIFSASAKISDARRADVGWRGAEILSGRPGRDGLPAGALDEGEGVIMPAAPRTRVERRESWWLWVDILVAFWSGCVGL